MVAEVVEPTRAAVMASIDANFVMTWSLQMVIALGVLATAVSSIMNRMALHKITKDVVVVKEQVNGRMSQLTQAALGQARAEGNLAGRVEQTEESRTLAATTAATAAAIALAADKRTHDVHITNESLPMHMSPQMKEPPT